MRKAHLSKFFSPSLEPLANRTLISNVPLTQTLKTMEVKVIDWHRFITARTVHKAQELRYTLVPNINVKYKSNNQNKKL